MRWIINYFREAFCKHDFNFDEGTRTVTNHLGGKVSGPYVYQVCKKCGYHKSYWKYD